jgi:hypothetical protein
MRAKTKRRADTADYRAPDETVTDAETERFIAAHHGEIEAKLRKARASVARGRAKPLEPLATLLRDARRRAKTR